MLSHNTPTYSTCIVQWESALPLLWLASCRYLLRFWWLQHIRHLVLNGCLYDTCYGPLVGSRPSSQKITTLPNFDVMSALFHFTYIWKKLMYSPGHRFQKWFNMVRHKCQCFNRVRGWSVSVVSSRASICLPLRKCPGIRLLPHHHQNIYEWVVDCWDKPVLD